MLKSFQFAVVFRIFLFAGLMMAPVSAFAISYAGTHPFNHGGIGFILLVALQRVAVG